MKNEIIFIDEETLTVEEIEEIEAAHVPERFARYLMEVMRHEQAAE